MTPCELDIDLYFYGELDDADRAGVDVHLRRCEACRQRLEDLYAIRRALAGRPVVDAPPAGDWSGFMRRLDQSTGQSQTRPRARRFAGSLRPRGLLSRFARVETMAAMLAIVALGIYIAAHRRPAPAPPQQTAAVTDVPHAAPAARDPSLREVTAEHLERSKLVVLGLSALDPKVSHAADWQYERRLAGTLLDDTRLYREMAQERGLNDVAHVMRDLETVLIETSMSDASDRDALARVQRLIAKRDLLVKMQLAASN